MKHFSRAVSLFSCPVRFTPGKLAVAMAFAGLNMSFSATGVPVPEKGINLTGRTESYESSATDVTITPDTGSEAIWLASGSAATITIGGGQGTLTVNKSGSWSAVQIGGDPSSTAANRLVVNGNLVVYSESNNAYESSGDITGIGDATLTVSGDLTVGSAYPGNQPVISRARRRVPSIWSSATAPAGMFPMTISSTGR